MNTYRITFFNTNAVVAAATPRAALYKAALYKATKIRAIAKQAWNNIKGQETFGPLSITVLPRKAAGPKQLELEF